MIVELKEFTLTLYYYYVYAQTDSALTRPDQRGCFQVNLEPATVYIMVYFLFLI